MYFIFQESTTSFISKLLFQPISFHENTMTSSFYHWTEFKQKILTIEILSKSRFVVDER